MGFRTVIANNDVLRDSLDAGDVDVTVNFAAAGHEHVASHPIFTDECVVVARRGHPVFSKGATLRELLRYGWILGGPTVATREWLEQAFADHGLPGPTVQVETSQVHFLPLLLEETDLLSFMSRRQLTRGSPLGEVKLRATTMRREFTLGYRKAGYVSPATRRVIEVVRKEAGRMWRGAARNA
jgi:DNA-binding transcriptional LysR family regulator